MFEDEMGSHHSHHQNHERLVLACRRHRRAPFSNDCPPSWACVSCAFHLVLLHYLVIACTYCRHFLLPLFQSTIIAVTVGAMWKVNSGGCSSGLTIESKVRGRRQPQNSRELAPMGWWIRPYAQTPVVWVPPDHLPRNHSDPRHLTSRDSNIRPKLREAVKAMRPVKFYGTWPGFVN